MYRSSLEQRDNMEVKIIPGESQEQFLTRVGSLPIVTAAMGQLFSIYNRTKESNGFVRFTLESAETGAKVAIATAQPITKPVFVKFEKPIGSLNDIACKQLDKLELAYPIITKPTDQVFEETFNVYKSTLKPSVDKVNSAKQFGVEKVSGVKQYGQQAVGSTCNKLSSAKDYGKDTIVGVAQYGNRAVSGVIQTSTEKIIEVANYGNQAVTRTLATSYGQSLVGKVDGLLDVTDQYIEHYLPDEQAKEEGEDEEGEEKEKAEVDSVETPSVPSKVMTISGKVRRRMYRRTIGQLQKVHLRSKETLDRLNFTVDLIQYAKDNLDGARGRLLQTGTKVKDIWTEINRPEEEVTPANDTTATSVMSNAADGEKTLEGQKVDNATLERRAIATARHLTTKLKGLMGYLTTSVSFLPTAVQESASQARQYTDHLYNVFSTTELKVSDIPQATLDLVRTQVTTLQDSMTLMATYLIETRAVKWLIPSQARILVQPKNLPKNQEKQDQEISVQNSSEPLELAEIKKEEHSPESADNSPDKKTAPAIEEEVSNASENLNSTFYSSDQEASFNSTTSDISPSASRGSLDGAAEEE